MRRVALAVLICAAATFAGYRLCYLPYRCNLTTGLIHRAVADPSFNATGNPRVVRSYLAQIKDCESVAATVDLFMLKAALLSELHVYDDAAAAYRSALELDHRWELYLMLAVTELRLGHREQAVAALAAAARFDPQALLHPDVVAIRREVWTNVRSTMSPTELMNAYMSMGSSLLQQNRGPEAVMLLADAAELDPTFLILPELQAYPDIVNYIREELRVRKSDASRRYL